MATIEMGGLVLRYRVTGAGPPLLLIRGLGRSLDYWGELEPLLAADFTVIAFDNRGVGGSDVTLPPYTTSQLADDAARLLLRLGIAQTHVFGLSLGGMIAQMLALRHPYRLRRLVLGCSTPGRRLGPPIGWRAASSLLASSLLPRARAQRLLASIILSPGHVKRHPETLEQWAELADRWPVRRSGFLGQLAAAFLHDGGEALRRIHVPTLLLHGTEDRLVPLASSLRLKELIPGSKLEAIPGTGHDFVAEQPERTARLLRGFLLAKG
ncbi:MAG: alpha/beta fold hydrolase [Deltaproteobacteria bacterium]|nr:alpha/beta fold hydrolase [Deltaproteobacteria bacterium]